MMSKSVSAQLNRLYWLMRFGIAFIWLWTAWVSWFIYPHSESLGWLRQVGLINHSLLWLASACLFDLVMGIGSALFASKKLWQFQLIVIIFYTLAVVIWLPECLFHPFGPIIKNIAVVGCLVFLIVIEQSRKAVG